jgi:putative oxidoreductase
MHALANKVFAPESAGFKIDFALLTLRVWAGLSILLLHGLDKLNNFAELKSSFPDALGIGPMPNLVLALFAEVFCAALLVLGLLTRFAALCLAVTMFAAFALVHNMALTGDNDGELAFMYLAGFVVILLAGPGRFSADACLFSKVKK